MDKAKLSGALVALAVVAVVFTVRSAPATASSNPIHITQCFISEPKPMSKKAGGTQIDYVITGSKTATVVVFGVGYRNAESHFYRKVTDNGTFQPGAPIAHHFSLYNDVTYAGKQTTSCSALKVTWSDGKTWVAQ